MNKSKKKIKPRKMMGLDFWTKAIILNMLNAQKCFHPRMKMIEGVEIFTDNVPLSLLKTIFGDDIDCAKFLNGLSAAVKMVPLPADIGSWDTYKKAFNDSVNDPSHLISNEAQGSLELFAQTLNVVIAEVKRQFLNGAQRIVLTRDGNSIFCEPDDYKVSQCL